MRGKILGLPLRRKLLARALVISVVPTLLAVVWLLWPMSGALPVPSGAATMIYDRNEQLLYALGDPNAGVRTKVSLSEIPISLQQATIAVEDGSFYEHPGIDIRAIARAFYLNLRGRQVVSGGSTITQQVVRNAYFSPSDRASHSLWRKGREAVLALRVNLHYSKDQVLAAYLNNTYYGNFAYGVDAAAAAYFGKPVRDLDLAECALLAGLPQAPSAYNPLQDLTAAKARQATVLDLMVRQGFISSQEAADAGSEKLRFASRSFPLKAPHFVAYVLDQLTHQYGDLNGLVVRTTLDLNMQSRAEEAVAKRVAELADKDASSGALVALDPRSGEILAMVGSADYFDNQIDGAVNVALSLRQPGSAIKPVVYATALEGALTPATMLADVRTVFLDEQGRPYSPENYDKQWHGPVLVRQALANSYNLPAVKVLQRIGLPAFLAKSSRFGLAGLSERSSGGLGLALGSGEVTLLDLTSAYAVIASGGLRRPPAAVLDVADDHGRSLWRWSSPGGERVLDARAAYLITDILSDNLARMATFGESSPLVLDRPAAVKTGTTSSWRDNWTIGYTPDLVTGVWVGNPDNQPMREVAGVAGAAPIWHDFMQEVLRGSPPRSFAEPDGLTSVEVCPLTGDLPSAWCPNRRLETFIRGTEPTNVCDAHVPVRVCAADGSSNLGNCPDGVVETRVYVNLVGELSDWARENGLSLPSGALAAQQPATLTGGLRVSLSSPDPNSQIQISQVLDPSVQRLEVAARVESGSAVRVELLVDGQRLVSLDRPPYRMLWPLRIGKHSFSAVAYDDSRNQVTSETVVVDVIH